MDRLGSEPSFEIESRGNRWSFEDALLRVHTVGFHGPGPFALCMALCLAAGPTANAVGASRFVTGLLWGGLWTFALLHLVLVGLGVGRSLLSRRVQLSWYRFTVEGFEARTTLGDVSVRWDEVVQYAPFDDVLVLFTRSKLTHVLARRSFTEPQWDVLLGALDTHVGARRLRRRWLLRQSAECLVLSLVLGLLVGGGLHLAFPNEEAQALRASEAPDELRGRFVLTSWQFAGATETPDWVARSHGKGFYFAANAAAHDLSWLRWPSHCSVARFRLAVVPPVRADLSDRDQTRRVEVRCDGEPTPLVFELTPERSLRLEREGVVLRFDWTP